jgi:hypothetical protein
LTVAPFAERGPSVTKLQLGAIERAGHPARLSGEQAAGEEEEQDRWTGNEHEYDADCGEQWDE